MIIKKLMRASLIGVVGLSALIVQAADTVVTNNWDVSPWNVKGPTLEPFTNMPPWALGTGNTNNGTISIRTDKRFWTNEVASGTSLIFSTAGITNIFSGAKIQPGLPLFVDMRCKIYPFATAPTNLNNTVLCFYSNQNSNLVVASKSASGYTQCQTNATITISTNEYYSVLIRFSTDTFDVYFNNSTTPLSLNATTNEISKMVISGDGGLDDLYVSYGDPRRDFTNYFVTGWIPNTPEECVVASWVASQAATNAALIGQTITSINAVKYYLTDTALSTNVFAGELGIGSFSYDRNKSNVTVVVTLKTGDDIATKKSGKINGLISLKGAGDYNAAKDNGWVDIGTKTILTNDFLNGVATYKFELTGNSNTNKFFLPVIKSNIH